MEEVALAEHPEVGGAGEVDLGEGQQAAPQLRQIGHRCCIDVAKRCSNISHMC